MKAATAARLFHDDEVKELFNDLRREYLDDFTRVKPGDTETMQVIRIKIDCLEDIRARLQSRATDHAKGRD